MRIAIVGAGVSGLVAAHLLAREHEVVIYEAGSYAGGHTNTIRVDTAYETHHVDTGFIVMNDRNYPNFTRLLAQLGVATQATNMSFSVKGEDEDFEYAGTPRGLICQPRNLAQPALPADDRRPLALQPRAAPSADTWRGNRRVAAGLPRAAALLRGLHPPPDRPPGLRRVVGRPTADLPPSPCASSPSSSQTTGCSASATARAGRPSPAARRATWRRSRGPCTSASGSTRPCSRSPARRIASRSPLRTARAAGRAGYPIFRPGRDRHPLRPGARDCCSDASAREHEVLGRDPLPAQRGGAAHRLHPAPPPSRSRAPPGTSTCCASPSR